MLKNFDDAWARCKIDVAWAQSATLPAFRDESLTRASRTEEG
jgi:hypothetical protein